MKKIFLLSLLFIPSFVFAQLLVPQGGTGQSSVAPGAFLVGSTSLRLTSTTSPTFGSIYATTSSSFLDRLGVGTTTPHFKVEISTSTAPQIELNDGTNVNGFAIRSVGNNTYFATTSPTTFATSSPVITILGQNGAVLINNSLSYNGGLANPRTPNLSVTGTSRYNDGYGIISACAQGTLTQQGSCMSIGYDILNGFAFSQAYTRGNTFDINRINPAGGCVSVGWSIGAGCTSLLSIDYPNQNPTQFSSNQALELGNGGNTGIWSLQTIGIGSHTSSATMPQIIFGGIQVTPSPAPHSAGYDFFIATRRDATAANTAPATSTTWTMSGVMEVGSSTPGYGTYTRSAKVLIATTTDPQLALENADKFINMRVLSDNSFVIATSSPLTGATSTPEFSLDSNGVPVYLNSGVVQLSLGVATISGVFIDSQTIIQHDTQSACLASVDVSATTTTSFTLTSENLTDSCLVGWNLIKHN